MVQRASVILKILYKDMEACNPLYNHHHHPCSPRSIIPMWHFGKLSLQRGLILPSVARPFLKREELLSNCNVVWLFTSASSEHSTLPAATKAPKKTHHGEKSLVKVLWNVKADLEDGQQLFVSGSDTLLGSWDPELAIPMSYCEGKINCWKTEVQVPRGTTFEYNYFVKCKNSIVDDVRWRFGPTLSLSLPSSKRAKKKIVKDGPIQISDCQSSDRNDAAPLGNLFLSHANMESIQTSDSHKEEMGREVSNLTYQPIEEPWLSISLMPSEEGSLPVCSTKDNEAEVGVTANNNDDDSLGSESNKRKKKLKRNSEAINSVFSLEEVSENGIESLEAQTPDVHGEECKQKSDADIEIIVNSSVCTVQRIAVLEDGKPVELLLEPVKTNVQVGNIYLGIIRKLIPGMRGAFVDIGDRQLAFLAMSKNRKPFTFPRLEEEQVNGATLETSTTLSYSEGRNINQGINNTVEDEPSTSYADAADEYEVISDTLIETCNNEGNIADDKTFHFTENRTEAQSYSNENEDTLTKIDCNQKSNKILREVSNEDNYVSDQWEHVKVGTKIIVQVIREALGTKGPTVTAFPCLTSRFWVLETRQDLVCVSRKIIGGERTRLKKIAKKLRPPDFTLIVRSVAEGQPAEELSKDLAGLLETWTEIIEKADSAFMEAEGGIEGTIPMILKRAKGQTLLVVQNYFNDKVQRMIVDSKHTFREVTRYLQGVSPHLVNRVELHKEKTPIFDKFGVENVMDYILSPRVPLPNGGYLVIQQTEALVSIDVNGGSGMLSWNKGKEEDVPLSKEQAILEVNLSAARQVVKELRLRDIGGIIVVDFIDMEIEKHKWMVYEEVKKAVEKDRSSITFSELSDLGLMELTRKRVRPSLAFKITEACPYCQGCGRVEALDTTFSKIERAIFRILAKRDDNVLEHEERTKPRVLLRVDPLMHDYLISGKNKRIVQLSKALKTLILLKGIRSYTRGQFEVTDFKEEKSYHDTEKLVDIRSKKIQSGLQGQKLRTWPFKAKPLSN